MSSYYWVTGMDGNGAATTAGPYMSEDEAVDATEHLTRTRIHILDTRQHDKARRILRDKVRGSGGGSMHSDEPLEPRSSLASRFSDFIRKRNDDDED
jgi:hypothetical protein